MTVYVDNDYKVYTEETINEEITDRMERYDYHGLYEYIEDHFVRQIYLLCCLPIFNRQLLNI